MVVIINNLELKNDGYFREIRLGAEMVGKELRIVKYVFG